MRRRYRAPDGLVHLASRREKHPDSPAYRQTVCEDVGDDVFFAGSRLVPTNEEPTCVSCIGAERRAQE